MPTAAQKFTPEKRAVFLDFLTRTGNVVRSAEAAGVTQSYLYRLRQKDPEFAGQWDAAVAQATDAIMTEARRRALEGWEQPVYYRGKQVGSVRRYSDNMLALLLRLHRPDVYVSQAALRWGDDHPDSIKARIAGSRETARARRSGPVHKASSGAFAETSPPVPEPTVNASEK